MGLTSLDDGLSPRDLNPRPSKSARPHAAKLQSILCSGVPCPLPARALAAGQVRTLLFMELRAVSFSARECSQPPFLLFSTFKRRSLRPYMRTDVTLLLGRV